MDKRAAEKLQRQEIKDLKDKDFAAFCLEVAIYERNVPEIRRVLLNIIEAMGGMQKIAKLLGLAPETLRKYVSKRGPVYLRDLETLIDAFGLELRVKPLPKEYVKKPRKS
jgi:DNA-binding phage protein